ncbi:hypothetical protein [Thiorhodovibrio frisius]|uniref:STI1 domain-containing protein n=1 Tax=Thiorhodovibrio frisius TaxID=631362 RepID=H8YWZ9_9GAMM|nr:hypothetical protein [Thiorhodovibrio frisius]EIC22975.1 hypothetical protein Thi970DRAFT_00624 [Thiorhodovibrio frisius]WPL22758.1 hypothetical protein Thiofri_02928 [Thiorhodovibrio frisius]
MKSMNLRPSGRLTIGRVLLVSVWLLTANTLVAGESRIELEDGSLITGEVLSSDGRSYRIRSRTLGTIEIDAEQIRSLRPSGSAGTSAGTSAGATANNQRVESIQKGIAADSGLLGSIMALENDPALQEALADDEFMRAISERDFETLRNHPTIRKLLENPQMRAIVDQIQGN